MTPGGSCGRRGRGKGSACRDSDVALQSEEVVSASGSGALGLQPAPQRDPALCSERLRSPSPRCVRVDGTDFSVGFCRSKRPGLSLSNAASSPYCDQTFLCSAAVTTLSFPRDPSCGGHAGCSSAGSLHSSTEQGVRQGEGFGHCSVLVPAPVGSNLWVRVSCSRPGWASRGLSAACLGSALFGPRQRRQGGIFLPRARRCRCLRRSAGVSGVRGSPGLPGVCLSIAESPCHVGHLW